MYLNEILGEFADAAVDLGGGVNDVLRAKPEDLANVAIIYTKLEKNYNFLFEELLKAIHLISKDFELDEGYSIDDSI
jgi:uncharacterized membrane protein